MDLVSPQKKLRRGIWFIARIPKTLAVRLDIVSLAILYYLIPVLLRYLAISQGKHFVEVYHGGLNSILPKMALSLV